MIESRGLCNAIHGNQTFFADLLWIELRQIEPLHLRKISVRSRIHFGSWTLLIRLKNEENLLNTRVLSWNPHPCDNLFLTCEAILFLAWKTGSHLMLEIRCGCYVKIFKSKSQSLLTNLTTLISGVSS